MAGLDKLERLLKVWGEKDCLLTMQTHMLLEIGEPAKARVANERFRAKSPRHPMGLLHQALIALAERNLGGATSALQDAMDAIKGTAIPLSFANAYRLLGLAWLQAGRPFAAHASAVRDDVAAGRSASGWTDGPRRQTLLGLDAAKVRSRVASWPQGTALVSHLPASSPTRGPRTVAHGDALYRTEDAPRASRRAGLASCGGSDGDLAGGRRAGGGGMGPLRPNPRVAAGGRGRGVRLDHFPARSANITHGFDRSEHVAEIRDLLRVLAILRAEPRTPEIEIGPAANPRPAAAFGFFGPADAGIERGGRFRRLAPRFVQTFGLWRGRGTGAHPVPLDPRPGAQTPI